MPNKIKSKIKLKTSKWKGCISSVFESRNHTSVDLGQPDIGQLAVTTQEEDMRSASDPGLGQRPAVSTVEAIESLACRSEPVEMIPVPVATTSVTIVEDTGFVWTGLQMLQDVLKGSVEMLVPLKSVVDDIMQCVGVLENETQAQKEYGTLKFELNDVLEDLTKLLQAAKTRAMQEIIVDGVNNVKSEMKQIVGKSTRNTSARFADASADVDDIEGFYRRTQKTLNWLIIKVNTKMMEAEQERAMKERLSGLSEAYAARYDSNKADVLHRGACTPETRVEVLRQLKEWSVDPAGHRIYWLNGMAGTGKTTIAYSACRELDSTNKLGASFFCSRQLPECRDVNRILPTIACQLARLSDAFREALGSVLEKTSDASSRSLADQFEYPIAGPLQKAESRFPVGQIVVIDALDECDDAGAVDRLLKALLAKGHGLPVHFFVTSRPEAKILDRMSSGKEDATRMEMRLHELERTTVQQDIRLYLTTELKRAHLSIAQVETLVERSGLLFIYAATVVRYVSVDNFARSTSRLRQVFRPAKTPSLAPEREIDVLYTSILEAARREYVDEDERQLMTDVLCTVICAREPLSLRTISRLLDVNDEQEIAAVLRPLYSVLQVAEGSRAVTTLHESFPNFMLSEARSKGLRCNEPQQNAAMATQCLNVIEGVQRPCNVCELQSSYVLDEQVPGLSEHITQHISDELAYACHYWAAHLERAQLSSALTQKVKELLETRLLLWLEVMNLKQYWSDAGAMMSKAMKWSKGTQWRAETRDLMRDAVLFVKVLYMGSAWRSTPHIYVSGLTYWPEYWPLAKRYGGQMSSGIVITGTAERGLALQMLGTIQTRSGVYSMAYSPEGAHIVSGADDHTLRIWNAHTGQQGGQPLQRHTETVWSVAYSPDGAHVVSGSHDHTLRIWDAHTGQQVGQPLQGHTSAVNSVAYSPDGAHVVSGSYDETLRIWDEPHTAHQQQVSQDRQAIAVSVCSWTVNPDGWIQTPQGELLIWIPPVLVPYLLRSHNSLMISRHGFLHLDFSHAYLGEHWERCHSLT